MTCQCDAYDFPHRMGGGACDECGCMDAPRCEHWVADINPHDTGDWWLKTYERVQK